MNEEKEYEKKYIPNKNFNEAKKLSKENLILQSFWKRLSQARKQRWFSQEDFANIVGLHRTYISDIERGKKNVSLINICKLAEGLDNMDINELMTF